MMKRRISRNKLTQQVFEGEKVKKKNSLLWLLEPLEGDPGFFQRKLFSFDAAYLDGRLYIAVKDGKEPWAGLLVCTYREHHAALVAEFPQLKPHEILGKWLHLPQSHPDFEAIALEIVSLALKRDPRLGVDAKPTRRRYLNHT
jgi:hypothetical protein